MNPGAPRLPPWLDRALKSPLAAAAALTLGVKIGHEVSRLRAEDINPREFKQNMGGHIGAVTGTTVGLGVGWLVGRLVPGAGNLIGAFAGGLLGEMLGERLGRKGIERLHRASDQAEDRSGSAEAGLSGSEGTADEEGNAGG